MHSFEHEETITRTRMTHLTLERVTKVKYPQNVLSECITFVLCIGHHARGTMDGKPCSYETDITFEN